MGLGEKTQDSQQEVVVNLSRLTIFTGFATKRAYVLEDATQQQQQATELKLYLQRMASTEKPYAMKYLFWQTVLFLLLHLVNVNAQSTCLPAEQPVVISLDPPSGTTGTDESLSTVYTITGERLDQVSSINVELEATQRRLELDSINTEERTITFRLSLVRIGVGSIATVTIVPNNTACSDITRTITIYDISKLW